MTVTNRASGTNVHEVSDGIYRINTPVVIPGGGGFSFNETFRHRMDYFSHTRDARAMIERLAAAEPATLACMHGSAWRGDGAKLLRALGESLSV